MARRKVSIQRSLGAKNPLIEQVEKDSVIDQLASSMSEVEIGFRPTDQRVYEVDLERVEPDPLQPRHLLPFDLRAAIAEKKITPSEAVQELVSRAERGDTVALLVLGGRSNVPVDESSGDNDEIEDTGLLALARSIREVGLRQPLNVYRINDPEQANRIIYRLGEGERRFWAHHLLVQQGYDEFRRVKCIIETLPDDDEIIHQRQEAENAARVDLPAIARARSIERIRERLNVELGTRVPGENTIKLPNQRELQVAVGQRVKNLTGRAISDRMVRNYLTLLNLSVQAQDLCEAAQLTEKQLRPVLGLKTDKERLEMIQRIVEEKWSGRKVLQEVTEFANPQTALREISQTTVEHRFEKRVLDAAKTVHSLLSLPQKNYEETITSIAVRAKDNKTRQALQSLRQALEEVLLKVESLVNSKTLEVSLLSVIPPLEELQHNLPAKNLEVFETEILTGSQIMDQLLDWRQADAILASRLEPFFNKIELDAEALRAGEPLPLPTLRGERSSNYSDVAIYEVETGASIYWAHEFLTRQGESQFKMMKAEVVSMIMVDGD